MALEDLKSRLTVLFIASIAAWIFGALVATLSESPLPTIFADGSPLTLVSLVMFTFSFFFFGYPSPFIMFLGGIFLGNRIRVMGIDAFSVVVSVVCIMAAYASIRLGDALLDDMIGKGNFKRAMKVSLVLTVLFLAISIALDLKAV